MRTRQRLNRSSRQSKEVSTESSHSFHGRLVSGKPGHWGLGLPTALGIAQADSQRIGKPDNE